MIGPNSTISYLATDPPLLAWRPASQPAFSICLALITTLLSYQAAATLLDLCFGLKPRGTARASDLYMHHLMLASSPQAIFRALFPPSPPLAEDTSPPKRLRIRVLTKLLLVLAAAPLMNILTVAATLEYDTVLTVARARMGGLALGLNHSALALGSAPRPRFAWAQLEPAEGDTPLVQFFLLLGPFTITHELSDVPRTATIEVSARRRSELHIRIVSPLGSVRRVKYVQVTFAEGPGQGTTYVLQHSVNQSAIDEWAEYGVELLAEWCSQDNPKSLKVVPDRGSLAFVDVYAGRRIECDPTPPDPGHMIPILNKMMDRAHIVDHESLQIADSNDLGDDQESQSEAFFPPDNYWSLKRRRGYLSFLVLTILLFVIIVVRVLTAVTTRNDVGNGMGLIVRDVLSLPWCDSMLASASVSVRHTKDVHLAEVYRDDGDGFG